MKRICLTKDEIDATLKHFFNGAEREDLSDEQLQWLERAIEMAKSEMIKVGVINE